MELTLKREFEQKYAALTDFPLFQRTLFSFLTKSFRVNTLKSSVSSVIRSLDVNWTLKKIPWCKEGFWISGERRDFGNLYEHQLGYLYVQEAASMLPPVVLDPEENSFVLDAAASPGSKTTQLAAMMKNTGLIIANDVSYQRMLPLCHNLQRCGVINAITTISDARRMNHFFDFILCDVPCSGVGTIRGPTGRSQYTMDMYSSQRVRSLSHLQKKLVYHAYQQLREKGTLVYSTCSLEPEEDEEVIQFLLDETDAKLEKIPLKIQSDVNLDYGNYSSELNKCIKLWPHFYDTEGFFIAKIKKL